MNFSKSPMVSNLHHLAKVGESTATRPRYRLALYIPPNKNDLLNSCGLVPEYCPTRTTTFKCLIFSLKRPLRALSRVATNGHKETWYSSDLLHPEHPVK